MIDQISSPSFSGAWAALRSRLYLTTVNRDLVDFKEELPRLPTGKLYKRLLEERYWAKKATRVV